MEWEGEGKTVGGDEGKGKMGERILLVIEGGRM